MKQPNVRATSRRSLATVTAAAVAVVVATSGGCASGSGGGPGTGPTYSLQVMITAAGQGDCADFPPVGHRPQCSVTSWENNTACYVIGLFPHPSTSGISCLCYEGQTRSCTTDGSLPGWCDTYGMNCGVQYCVVTGTGALAHSDWESDCHPI